ncbi:hypothetical protein ACFZBU_38860 [Embleya sp. NPDC008237]|uniref:hypothetical protein n=1 Tax=Embleya sp. NPDC008237 TaxID=3363978 RepID=UPI0036EA4B57
MDEDSEGDRFSDAVRLLLLIAAVGEPLDEVALRHAPEGAVAVVRSEGRLQKLDFWLRNPDYLADELLNDYERVPEAISLELAGEILDSDEPEIACFPMLRYLFGAFEYIDRAMSVLVAPRLVRLTHGRTPAGKPLVSYYLTAKGRAVADQATANCPELAWFTRRAVLVRSLAESTGHTVHALRRRQYLQRDYAETPLNELIPSIAERARERLARLRATAATGSAA